MTYSVKLCAAWQYNLGIRKVSSAKMMAEKSDPGNLWQRSAAKAGFSEQ